MKKVILFIIIILLVVLAALVTVPFLFKDSLLEKTKNTISQNTNVKVNFGDFTLSLIHNFPKASLSIKNILVTGKNKFVGDTLLKIASLRTKFGILDLLTPGSLSINELIVNDPRLNLVVNKQNLPNWEIFPQEGTTGKSHSKESSFRMQLDKIEINRAYISYKDLTVPMYVDFQNVNLKLKGNLYGNNTHLNVSGNVPSFNLNYDSSTIISQTSLDLKSKLDIDFGKWDFRFGEGEMLVNNLPLAIKGNFSLPGDSIFFNLDFKSEVSGLADFLTLVPPDYNHYLKDLDAKGKAELSGTFKGIYHGESYPALKVLFTISGGNLHYAGLPEEITNISSECTLSKPQGGFELLSVDFSRAHAQIKNTPVDFSLRLSDLLDDIHFKGNLNGRLDFDQLKDAIPMDSVQLSGLMDVDLGFDGNYSAIETKQYEQVKTEGTLGLNQFKFSSGKITYPVQISSGTMDFSPEAVNLRQMDMKIGQSDFTVSGNLTDYYAFIFNTGIMTGNVNIASDYMNLNELMSLQKPDEHTGSKKSKKSVTQADTPDSIETAFVVPEKINLTIHADVKKALYDQMIVSGVRGQVIVHNGKINLEGLNMNLMDGELRMAGVYETSAGKTPLVDLVLDMKGFDIPGAFQSLKLIRNYIPIAAQSKGKFNTSIRLKGQLDNQMGIIVPSLNGNGTLTTENLQVVNSPVFNKIKSVLKEEKLRDVRIDDFMASFTIEKGNLLLKPFKTRISGQEATFSGQLSSTSLINMNIRFIIQRDALSENIENTLGVLPGQRNIQTFPVNTLVKGPVGDPDVKVDLSEATQLVKREVGKATRQEIKTTINKIGDGLKKLFK